MIKIKITRDDGFKLEVRLHEPLTSMDWSNIQYLVANNSKKKQIGEK